jgi:hypothetical protein
VDKGVASAAGGQEAGTDCQKRDHDGDIEMQDAPEQNKVGVGRERGGRRKRGRKWR